jgi:Glycosyl transferase family 2
MSLSLCVVTKDSAAYIEKLLRVGKLFADELVVAVDESSSDSTEAVCAKYADRLFRLEPIGYVERALAWLNGQCRGDWILRLDDDELPSLGLVNALPQLTSDREMTHYFLPIRTVINAQSPRWIGERPWWPRWQLRLFRNISSIVQAPERLHTNYVVQGAGRYVDEGALYHLDLIYHTDSQRQEKVERYESLSPGNSQPSYYLVENKPALLTFPFPPNDPPIDDAKGRLWRMPLQELRRRAGSRGPRHAQCVSLEELRQASLQNCQYTPEVFRGALTCLGCPPTMHVGQACPIEVDVLNESPVVWTLPTVGVPNVQVTYHWLHPSGDTYEFLGLQTPVPHTLRPGETTKLVVWVLPPTEPGLYRLQWDLLIEQVAWFSTRGWPAPEFDVQVVRDDSSALQYAVTLPSTQVAPS